jgi:2-methylcitrate dehydratase PrpD
MQYSLVWPVATALARGRFGVDEVLGGFDDPLVAQIAERVRIEVDPELTSAFPARRLTELEVVSSDGSTLRSGVIEAAGEPRSAAFEDILAGKVLRFLDPEVALPLAVHARPPATLVSGRSREELVRLLAFGLDVPALDRSTPGGDG